VKGKITKEAPQETEGLFSFVPLVWLLVGAAGMVYRLLFVVIYLPSTVDP
jgi:hypothetical protein